MHQICAPLVDLVDSLRSNVAKNAMLGLHDLYYYLGSAMVRDDFVPAIYFYPNQSDGAILERMLAICLRKAGIPGAGNFLIVEAERALRQICLSVTAEARLVVFLLRNLKDS